MVKKAAHATSNRLLRAARKERGWTQQQVADGIGAPLSLNVSRWENGTAFPSLPPRHLLQTGSKAALTMPENLLYEKRKAKRHPIGVFWKGKHRFKEARLQTRRRMSKSQSRPSRKILLSRRSTRSKRWRCP